MIVNTLLILISLVIFAIVVVVLYFRAKSQTAEIVVDEYDSIEKVVETVKTEVINLLREDFSMGLSEEEFNKLYKRKARINDALKNCVYGIDSAKILVIDLIRGIIAEKVPPQKVTELLGLDETGEPSAHIKFEILMYKYKKRYGKKALAKWIEKYHFDEERLAEDSTSSNDKAYYITEEDLNRSYREENIQLTIEEQIDILSILVYQRYKGFGIIDTLREMDINGFNCGTSGSILYNLNKVSDGTFRANKSVWLYYQGKYIHLRFMDFGTEEELRRVIQLMIRYGNPGPLTAKRGYLVNTMYDKSRILAIRPPASEYWAVFVRKFNLADISPEALIIKPYTHKGELATGLLEFLMRGHVTSAVTGRQGAGKTTLMSSIVRYIDPRFTIRVLELAPELYLRELYPTRNILSVQETTYVTAAELQDALKKSDGTVSIVGEVATDAVAARMIQMGQVASLFTIFSHHANTTKDLVFALRNSLANTNGFSNNLSIAEKQVTDVVKCDIHLNYTPDGKRYIERITEIIQLEEGAPYPDYDPNNPVDSMNRITKEYYERITDRVGFITRDILRYDLDTHTYIPVNRFSKQLEEKIRSNLGKELQAKFDYFMLKEWGPREDDPFKTKEEIERELDRLKKLANMKIDDNIPSINNLVDLNEIIDNEEAIKEQAEDKSLWAKGYEPDNSSNVNSEFSIGLFFDDEQEGK